VAVDLEEYRRVSRETWRRMATGWERELRWMWDVSRPVGESLVAMLSPQPGQTILELAAGTGETGFAAAAHIGERGKLISSDFAFEMVQAARRRAAQLDLHNVEFRVMDAERMDLDDDSVDGVICRWGYMLMPDPAAALAETRRVLRRHCRLCFSVWAEPARNPWAAIAADAAARHGHLKPSAPGDPGVFAMADPARIRSLLKGAGFEPLRIDEVEIVWRFDDLDRYWSFLLEFAGAIALILQQLDPEERAVVRATIDERAEPYRAYDGAYEFPGVALNAVAN
jgi:SAM-dependent methyltransferase